MGFDTAQQATAPPSTSLTMLFSDPRLAVQADCIVCLICGGRFRQLTNTHLKAHGTDVVAYKERFGYNRRRALMSGALHSLYAERAVKTGLADRIRHRPIVEIPELRRRGGARPISLEEQLTRREAQRQALAARRIRLTLVTEPPRSTAPELRAGSVAVTAARVGR